MGTPPTTPPFAIRNGQLQYQRLGLPFRPFADLYHVVINTSWTGFLCWTLLSYGVINVVFALLFLAGGDCINAEDPGSFMEAFSFSVQTFSTIGYGTMSPTTPWAHLVVFVESFIGLIGVAMITGLALAKFARPQARISFSSQMVVQTRNGRPVLSFRMANERNSRIIDAHCQLYVLVQEVSDEGETMRRFYPLPLERERSPMFLLTWSAFHVLDGSSPLAGLTEDNAPKRMVSLVVIVLGVDEGLAQGVHAQHFYTPADIRFGHRFVDLIDVQDDGSLRIHHDRLHHTMPNARPVVTDALPQGVDV